MAQDPPLGATCPVPPHVTADPGTFERVWAGRLHDLFTLDGDEMWIGEDGGRIRHRDPTSGTWNDQPVPKDVRGGIHRLHFLSNGLTGFAISADGFVLKTQDGGNSWPAIARIPALDPTQIAVPGQEWERLFDVWFAENGTDGWLVAERGILYTTDGGVCWKVADLFDGGVPIDPTTLVHTWAALYGLDVRISGTDFLGLAVGRPGTIFRSTDWGRTWDVVLDWDDVCPTVQGSCLEDACNGVTVSPWFELWDVEIGTHPSEPLALVTGSVGVTCGLILSSSDDGLTWVRELHECEHPASGVQCDCTAGCDAEYDPGQPPSRLTSFRGLYGVGIFPDNTAVVAGYNGQHLRREILTDGTGVTTGALWRDRSEFGPWTLAPVTVTIFPLYGAVVPELPVHPGRAFLTGVGGHLRRTDDGGETWIHELLGEPFRTSVTWFKTSTTDPTVDVGWQAGQYFRIAFSLDGGETWTQSTPERTYPQGATLRDIAFAGDGDHGVMVGSATPPILPGGNFLGPRVILTDNFGSGGWSLPAQIQYDDSDELALHRTSGLRAVRWSKDPGNQQFWAVGDNGLVLRSTDGGANWNQQQISNPPVANPHQLQLHGVAASGPSAVVVVGRMGSMAKAYGWSNGTWSEIPLQSNGPGTIRLLSAVSITGSSIYAVGHREQTDGTRTGVVLKYDPGAQPVPAFVEFPGPFSPSEVEDCADAGSGDIQDQVLTAVEVLSNGDLWIAGTCGRVWQRVASTQQWVEHKSQTDADIRKMMFLSPTRGYFAALGGPQTNQVILRYQGQ